MHLEMFRFSPLLIPWKKRRNWRNRRAFVRIYSITKNFNRNKIVPIWSVFFRQNKSQLPTTLNLAHIVHRQHQGTLIEFSLHQNRWDVSMLSILPTSDLSPSLSSASADGEKTVPENKVGKIAFIENWPSQQFSVILFHAMNKNKNQKPLWFKWSS